MAGYYLFDIQSARGWMLEIFVQGRDEGAYHQEDIL